MKNLSVAWIMTNHPLWLGRTKVVQGVANVMNYYPWDRQHFATTIGLTIIAPESHSLWIAILLFTNCLFERLDLINIQTMFQSSKHPLSDQVPDKDKSWPKMSNLVSHIFPLHLQCTVCTDSATTVFPFDNCKWHLYGFLGFCALSPFFFCHLSKFRLIKTLGDLCPKY